MNTRFLLKPTSHGDNNRLESLAQKENNIDIKFEQFQASKQEREPYWS